MAACRRAASRGACTDAGRGGTARIFLPSRGWASYRATPDETKKLTKWNRTKKARIRDKQRRLTKYRTSLRDDENRSGVSERGRSDMLERGRSNPQKLGVPARMRPIQAPKSGFLTCLKEADVVIPYPLAVSAGKQAGVQALFVLGIDKMAKASGTREAVGVLMSAKCRTTFLAAKPLAAIWTFDDVYGTAAADP